VTILASPLATKHVYIIYNGKILHLILWFDVYRLYGQKKRSPIIAYSFFQFFDPKSKEPEKHQISSKNLTEGV